MTSMPHVVSSRGRYWIAPVARPNFASVWTRGRAMRLDRVLLSAGLAAALSGCVTTTTTEAGGVATKIPRTTKAEQREEGARVHTQLGQQYMEHGDLQDAMVKLNKALDFDPNFVPAHTVLAVVYERINDLPNAELHYR